MRKQDEPRSVFDLGLARMGATTRSMDMSPMIPASGSPRSVQGDNNSAASSPRGNRTREDPPRAKHFRVAQAQRQQATSSSPMGSLSRKILTPGPGAYKPETDRFGLRDGPKPSGGSFGSARQRPHQVCSATEGGIVSPGPVYMPLCTYTSNLSSPAQTS